MHESEIINRTLSHICEQTGLELVEDSYFGGLQTHHGRVFFNVELDKPTFYAPEVAPLERLADSSTMIYRVAVNGHKRLAIFLRTEWMT